MTSSAPDLVVLHEHPEWQKPLFAALETRGVAFAAFDVTGAAFSNLELPIARLYFNQASPSAYIRGHARAVPQPPGSMLEVSNIWKPMMGGAYFTMSTRIRTCAPPWLPHGASIRSNVSSISSSGNCGPTESPACPTRPVADNEAGGRTP